MFELTELRRFNHAFGNRVDIADVEFWPNSIRESQLAGRGVTRTSSTCKELKHSSMMLKIHRLYQDETIIALILEKLEWPFLILHGWKISIQKASSKIKRIGRSVSQRRMPRETEKPPLTVIDEKPTDGTSASKKDPDGHEMMKSENFLQVSEPRRRIDEFFLSRRSWSDECWFFFSTEFFSTEFFWGFRAHVVATAVCTTGCVHTLTHLLHAHFSVAQFVCAHPHIFMRVHIHAWLKYL